MKKRILTFCIIIVAITYTCLAQKVVIPGAELPSEIKSYIATHFPNQSINIAIKDNDDYNKTFKIILDNLTKFEFNQKKEIIEIKGKFKLPNTVIPDKILTYVNSNYSGNFIVGWKLDNNKQEIELDNGIELEFKINDEFLRVDN